MRPFDLHLILFAVVAAGCATSDATEGTPDATVIADAAGADASVVPDAVPPDAREDAATGECAGKADGVACGNTAETACDLTDTCLDQVCVANLVAEGTPCGDPTTRVCDDPDVCDGAGACSPNYVAAATPCGSGTTSDCDGADSCDGAGTCAPNLASDGTGCADCEVAPCATCAVGECTCASTPLNTTFASNNGLAGSMFDVTALSTITVRGLEVNLPAGTHTLQVYFKAGTYVGSEGSSANWTLVGATAVTSLGQDLATPLVMDFDLQLVSGQTYGLYVTISSGAALRYTNGTTAGAVFTQDGNLQIKEGIGVAYPFGDTFTPRVWNGRVLYDRCSP